MPPTTQIRGEQILDGSIDAADIDDAVEKEFTKVRTTTDDSTPGFLSTKLVAGPNITLTVVGASGSSQTLAITSSAGGTASITGGTITGITDLAVADGGTGASDAATARTNLGLAIGTNVQAFSSVLDSVSNSTYTGSNSITNVGTITVGTWNGTAVPVSYGGTGATSATNARTNLGVAIGTNVQAYSSVLDSVAASTYTGSNSITNVGTVTAGAWNGTVVGASYGGTGNSTYALGDTLYALSPTALAKLPGNTTTTRQFLRQTGTGVTSLAPAWDTVTKTDVGLGSVENTALSTWTGSSNISNLGTVTIGTWNATAVPVLYGGTGATASTGARTNLGLAIGTDVQAYSAGLTSFGSTWTPGVYADQRHLYSTISGYAVGMGVNSTSKISWIGSYGPSNINTPSDLVIYVSNSGSIQIDKTTCTIHPFTASLTASDLGTTALPFRNIVYSGVITSSVATGTSPFSITSTTEVANLNASRVAGKIPTATPTGSALPLAEASGRLNPGWIMNSQTLTDGATINWDMSLGTGATVTLTATGRTMAAPTNLPPAGTSGKLIIVQDAGGSKTITTWNAIFKWPGGTAITLSTGANKRDIIDWYYDGTGILMLGQYKNY